METKTESVTAEAVPVIKARKGRVPNLCSNPACRHYLSEHRYVGPQKCRMCVCKQFIPRDPYCDGIK